MSRFSPYDFLNWSARLFVAQAVIIMLVLLNVASLSLPHAGDLKPFFVLIAVYFWSINRPTLLPAPYTFLLGLMLDILGDLPLGVSALVLVLMQAAVYRSRVFLMGQPFVAVWFGFAVLCFLYAFVLWLVLSILHLSFFPKESFVSIMLAALLTALLYPPISWVLHSIQKILPEFYNPVRLRGRS